MTAAPHTRTGIVFVLLYLAVGFVMPLPLDYQPLGTVTDATTAEAVIMGVIMVLVVGWGVTYPHNETGDVHE